MTRTLRRLAPPPRLTLSEWADAYRHLPPETTAEPGRWSTARAEYLRGIMDAISDPRVERVVIMAAARTGKTEIINNLVGYHIGQDPAPILVVYPTETAAEEWSRDKLEPMLRDSPSLRSRIPPARSRDSQNKTLHKVFPGGRLYIVGANAPTGLAAKNIRVVCFDEVDRYGANAGGEGDPVAQGIKRTANFWNRKIVLASSPKLAGSSLIEAEYEASDQRRYHVPCPHCDHLQVLRWAQVRWPADAPTNDAKADAAAYHCEACGAAWTDAERWEAIATAPRRGGGWRAGREGSRVAGFHLSVLYSPWRTIAQTVDEWLRARTPEQVQVFVNTALGEPWQEAADAPDWRLIADRRTDGWRRGELPEGVLFLTHTADVQGDRLEWDVWGWGEGLTAWLVDSGVVEGSPHDAATWAALQETQGRRYRDRHDREWGVDACGVDAGWAAQDVYGFVAGHPNRDNVFALKGSGDINHPPIGAPRRVAVTYEGKREGTVALWSVGSHGLKLAHYAALRRTIEGGTEPGAIHLPEWVPPEYAQQLTAEVLTMVQPRAGGPARPLWRRLPNVRNERLDTAVYGRAVAQHIVNNTSPAAYEARKAERAAPAVAPAILKPQAPPRRGGEAGYFDRRRDWF